MHAVRKDGTVAQRGDVVTDFRGLDWVMVYPTALTDDAHAGKVLVDAVGYVGYGREFYATVFGLKVVSDDE